ncbi:MAG: zinc ribbon domain-containing protein [Coleofasciculaceae cyanobacterium SM2_1_6]|nr:zinc ribbon domain-containing protein [Coleofasciculaceae cyanobacterium SM2_1_6]
MPQYVANLTAQQQIYLENQGNQTVITLLTGSPHQQQSQSTSWQTGVWIVPPILWRGAMGFILRVEGQGGQFLGLIQGSSISTLAAMPAIADAQIIPLQTLANPDPDSTFPSMQPLQPMASMPPMPPMQMQMPSLESMPPMPPMQMRLGNMHMQMGGATSQVSGQSSSHATSQSSNPSSTSSKATSTQSFCSQCGAKVRESDRFCAHCGHQIQGS